ncbi:MAG: DUF4116 domain-containing protein [Clostridia bacterium]|nr:DUF4116 domain-containing protein [Clostridia bacterium]
MTEEKEYDIEDVEKNSDNRSFMMQALANHAPWVIAYASNKLHADKELMLEAVKQDGQLLYYASKELRDDKEVVGEAIKNKWLILKYASKRLRSDEDIAKIALEINEKSKEFLIKTT